MDKVAPMDTVTTPVVSGSELAQPTACPSNKHHRKPKGHGTRALPQTHLLAVRGPAATPSNTQGHGPLPHGPAPSTFGPHSGLSQGLQTTGLLTACSHQQGSVSDLV